MSTDHHARRFVPRWLFPANETDAERTSDTPDAFSFPSYGQLTNAPAGQEFDEALEQISSEGWCVCPLCGAIVSSDGTVVG